MEDVPTATIFYCKMILLKMVEIFFHCVLNSFIFCMTAEPPCMLQKHTDSKRSLSIRAVLFLFYFIYRSRGSSGSIVSDYGLDDRGSIPDRGRGFFF
jgi:hypothetical protein